MNHIKRNSRVERLEARFRRQAQRGDMVGDEMVSKKDQRRYRRADKKIEKAKGTKREQKVRDKYGYDYKAAAAAGIERDETGHMSSRDPETGRILKGAKHPTIYKTKKFEKALGYKIRIGKDGKMYSVKKKNNKS